MKLFRKIDEIDRLEEEQNKLERDLERKKSKINSINSKLEAKIKRLEEIAYINRTDLEKFEASINLKLDKNSKLIIAASEYAQKLGAKYNKKRKRK